MPEPERTDDGRYIIVRGRRWRAQDPELPDELVQPLLSHLGKARSALRRAKELDEAEVARLRERVTWAKEGLGERGTPWWELDTEDRCDRARNRIDRLGDEA